MEKKKMPKKAKQRHDKLRRPVAGGIPARVPAESEAAQGSLSALRDEQNSLDRSLEAYPPGSLPKVWLCGEVWRLANGESRGGVLKEDTPNGRQFIKGTMGVLPSLTLTSLTWDYQLCHGSKIGDYPQDVISHHIIPGHHEGVGNDETLLSASIMIMIYHLIIGLPYLNVYLC
jgi:hypothetical protein